jgi:hypothetical protein
MGSRDHKKNLQKSAGGSSSKLLICGTNKKQVVFGPVFAAEEVRKNLSTIGSQDVGKLESNTVQIVGGWTCPG